jgi:hypothetical protein
MQIRRAIDRRDDEDAALDERQVMPFQRVESSAAEAGIGKHGLDHDDATDQPADIDGQNVMVGSSALRNACRRSRSVRAGPSRVHCGHMACARFRSC